MDNDEQTESVTVDELRNDFATMGDTTTRDYLVVAVDDKGKVWNVRGVTIDDDYEQVVLSVEHDQSTRR